MLGTSQKLMKQSRIYSTAQVDSFKQLQGDCKIKSTQYLKFSIIKTVLIIIPIIVSIIGLFILKYYPKFRVKAFYFESNLVDATHIFIIGEDETEKIIKFSDNKKKSSNDIHPQVEQIRTFFYRKLKYKILDDHLIPIGLNLRKYYSTYVNQHYLETGLNTKNYQIQLDKYGKNQHRVEAPNYFEYAVQIMTQPFFLIQYLASIIYFAQQLASLAILLLVASILTVSINYILLYISYKKIKQVAQKQIQVQILRNSQKIRLPHKQLVPGDIFLLEQKKQIPCDCLLLKGQVYVNQSSLTGQSVPIGKFPCQGLSQLKDSSKWLYQGSMVLSFKQDTIVMAVHTGYTSKRGRIIRKILSKKQKLPQFFKSVIYFLFQIWIFAIIAYFATLSYLLDADIQKGMIIILFFLYITFSFPPAFPIYFNLAYSLCLLRLKFKGINGTQPQKTIQGTNLKIMCFDKTGTLTQQKVILHKIFKFHQKQPKKKPTQITQDIQSNENQLIKALFSTCHCVKQFDGEYQGDQIDLKMFLYSNTKIDQCNSQGLRCKIKDHKHNKSYEILRINQYQSKFQSMSVLVRDANQAKYYVFCKGAPEKMHSFSKVNYGQRFTDLVEQLSYQGLRTIAFSYKQIPQKQVSNYQTCQRDTFLKSTHLLGLVAFQNKLKDDAVETISRLRQANIQPKMITGDSIFIAIETAIRARILDPNQQIVIIEGAAQSSQSSQSIQQYQPKGNSQKQYLIPSKHSMATFNAKIVSLVDGKIKMEPTRLSMDQYLSSERSIAVDDAFLELQSSPQLIQQIKVFSRITPENKARIVRTYKNQFKDKKQKLSFCDRFTGKPIERVGMAGDGANDLIALKQADIGMGISNSDASYAATFSINQLLDIDQILRESKGTERSIIEVCRFYSITNFLSIALLVPLFGQGSFLGDFQLLYLNLSKLIILNLAIPLSRAQSQPTKYKPQSNFLGLQNHLVFWGNVLIYTGGYVACYIYGRDFSNQFIPNPQPTVTFDDGYYSQTFSVTILFLAYNVQPPTLAFFLYKSKPWKQRIWGNIVLFLIIVINIGWGIALFFLTVEVSDFFELIPLSDKVELTVFIIMLITCVVAFLWNLSVDCLKLHQRQFIEKEEQEFVGTISEKGNSRKLNNEMKEESV